MGLFHTIGVFEKINTSKAKLFNVLKYSFHLGN